MFRESCKVVSQENVAPGHFVLTLESPKISKSAKPGQFVQVLCDNSMDPLLPRPFSFLTVTPKNFSLLYHVVGKGTQILSKLKKGDSLNVLGPCGNGFTLPNSMSSRAKSRDLALDSSTRPIGLGRNDNYLLVGGGVGIPPLYHFAQELLKKKISKKNIHVFLGARDKSLLLCEKEFKKLGITLHPATDNGSRGFKGFVTELLESFLDSIQLPLTPSLVKRGRVDIFPPLFLKRGLGGVGLFTCGPTSMMKAVAMLAQKYQTSCEISVEVPMACGFGACLGCAVKVHEGTGHRHAIACCEGPVFSGEAIVWE